MRRQTNRSTGTPDRAARIDLQRTRYPLISIGCCLSVYVHRLEARVGIAAHAIMVESSEADRARAIPRPYCFELLYLAANRHIAKDEATSPHQAWNQSRAWASSPPIGSKQHG